MKSKKNFYKLEMDDLKNNKVISGKQVEELGISQKVDDNLGSSSRDLREDRLQLY
jgi:hypothetical protein